LPTIIKLLELPHYKYGDCGFRVLQGYGPAGVEEPASNTELPEYDLRLEANHPNPFQGSTAIDYQLPQGGKVNLSVYNISGQLVATLVEGQQPAGRHRTIWDGRDSQGIPVAGGVYLCRLKTISGAAVRKMTVLR